MIEKCCEGLETPDPNGGDGESGPEMCMCELRRSKHPLGARDEGWVTRGPLEIILMGLFHTAGWISYEVLAGDPGEGLWTTMRFGTLWSSMGSSATSSSSSSGLSLSPFPLIGMSSSRSGNAGISSTTTAFSDRRR